MGLKSKMVGLMCVTGHEDTEVTELATDVRRRLSERKAAERNHLSQSASSKSLFVSPAHVAKSPRLMPLPAPVVNHSSRLVKSEAR